MQKNPHLHEKRLKSRLFFPHIKKKRKQYRDFVKWWLYSNPRKIVVEVKECEIMGLFPVLSVLYYEYDETTGTIT